MRGCARGPAGHGGLLGLVAHALDSAARAPKPNPRGHARVHIIRGQGFATGEAPVHATGHPQPSGGAHADAATAIATQ